MEAEQQDVGVRSAALHKAGHDMRTSEVKRSTSSGLPADSRKALGKYPSPSL